MTLTQCQMTLAKVSMTFTKTSMTLTNSMILLTKLHTTLTIRIEYLSIQTERTSSGTIFTVCHSDLNCSIWPPYIGQKPEVWAWSSPGADTRSGRSQNRIEPVPTRFVGVDGRS